MTEVRRFVPASVCYMLVVSSVLFGPLSLLGAAHAAVIVHDNPLAFEWEPALGNVEHYHVYVSRDGGPLEYLKEVPDAFCEMAVVSGHRYVIQVEGESPQGEIGPRSDPSVEVVVFLVSGGGGEPGLGTDGDVVVNELPADGLLAGSASGVVADVDGNDLSGRMGGVPVRPLCGMDGEASRRGMPHPDACGPTGNASDAEAEGVEDGIGVAREPGANRPVAVAEPMLFTKPGVEVVLDGGESFDADGDNLIYNWSQRSGPAVQIKPLPGGRAVFLPLEEGTYGFCLQVADQGLASCPQEVLVWVTRNPLPSCSSLPAQASGPQAPGSAILFLATLFLPATVFLAWKRAGCNPGTARR